MNTDLNNKVKQFFSQHKLEEINISNIKNHFNNIFQENEYGGLIHAAVHNKYPIDKILKFIEVLLENKVNPNLKGKLTGYSFIHLALYGYTDNNKDFSYSTNFIVDLINLAKKYDFDVNIKDKDSDSLIHTALASEVYTGEIIPLINALGEDFDIDCKDDNDHNIYQALLEYKEEAQEDSNREWLNRLIKEEEKIERLIKMRDNSIKESDTNKDNSKENSTQNDNSEEDNEELKELQEEIKTLKSKTDLQYLQKNYHSIIYLLEKSNDLINLKESSTKRKKQEFKNVITDYLNLIKKILRDSLEQISTNPNTQTIDSLSELIEAFGFDDLNTDLLTIENKYYERIAEFKESIEDSQTLAMIKELDNELSSFNEEKIKNELKEKLDDKSKQFKQVIDKIQTSYTTLEIIFSCLDQEDSKNHQLNQKNEIENMTINELEELNADLEDIISTNRNLIKQSITNKLEKILELIDTLNAHHIFEDNELFDLLKRTIPDEIQSNKKEKNYYVDRKRVDDYINSKKKSYYVNQKKEGYRRYHGH